jgi:hypothetical protein
VPLVEDVKRLGKIVIVSFFDDGGLNRDLRETADEYADLTEQFSTRWWQFRRDLEQSHRRRHRRSPISIEERHKEEGTTRSW